MKYFIDTEFIEKPNTITLISIGIVCEDGRELYRINREYNYKDADEWVQKNVIVPMYIQTVHGDNRNMYSAESFHQYYGKSIRGIRDDIVDFINNDESIEFYGYYADYDWVVFCWIFGKMINLPKGFPMYCRDLKQTLDNQALTAISMQTMGEERDLKKGLEFIKSMPEYPKQINEHNALDDARWNFELYKFLTA